MSTVVEIEPQAVDLDPVFCKLRDAHEKIARRANQWIAFKGSIPEIRPGDGAAWVRFEY